MATDPVAAAAAACVDDRHADVHTPLPVSDSSSTLGQTADDGGEHKSSAQAGLQQSQSYSHTPHSDSSGGGGGHASDVGVSRGRASSAAVVSRSSLLQVRPAREANATDDPLLAKLGATQDGSIAVVNGAPPLPRPASLTLCFADPLLERKFRYYYFYKRLGPARIMIPLVLLLMVLLSVYDIFFTKSDKQQLIRILRYGFQLPLTIIWYALTFSPLYFGVTQPLNTGFALVIGGLSIALSVAGEHPDHGPHMVSSGGSGGSD